MCENFPRYRKNYLRHLETLWEKCIPDTPLPYNNHKFSRSSCVSFTEVPFSSTNKRELIGSRVLTDQDCNRKYDFRSRFLETPCFIPQSLGKLRISTPNDSTSDTLRTPKDRDSWYLEILFKKLFIVKHLEKTFGSLQYLKSLGQKSAIVSDEIRCLQINWMFVIEKKKNAYESMFVFNTIIEDNLHI